MNGPPRRDSPALCDSPALRVGPAFATCAKDGHAEFDGWTRTSNGTCGSRSLRFGREDGELRRWRRAEVRAVEVPHSCAKSKSAHEWATLTR